MQTIRQNEVLLPKQDTALPGALPHNLILENRKTATATGITKIVSYDETGAQLETRQGTLLLGGQGLQVSELSLQTGELKIYGKIDYVQYSETKKDKAGFFKRLVR